jgi:hypothetical protein
MPRLHFISLLFSLALLGGGCGKGTSVLLVTVTTPPGVSSIVGIQQFSGSVQSGPKSGTFTITPMNAPITIPPNHQFSLSFDASTNGTVTVNVQAVGANGASLAAGKITQAISPSQQFNVTIPLIPGAVLPGTYAIRSSSISTLGPTDHSGQYRIFDDGFEFGAHTCAGATCVTGGITP